MNFTRGRHHRVYFGEVSRIIVAIELNLFEVIRITPRLDQEIYRWIVRTSLYIKPQAFLLGNALLSYRHEFMLKCLSIFRFDSKHDFDMQWFFLHRVTPLSRKDEPRKTTINKDCDALSSDEKLLSHFFERWLPSLLLVLLREFSIDIAAL
jgi:hypothetical protein